MSYARLCRKMYDLSPSTAASALPLVIGADELNEMIDGTDLTVDEALQVANHGILVWPRGLDFPTA